MNYSTEFCVEIENLTPEEKTWLLRQLDYEAAYDESQDGGDVSEFVLAEQFLDPGWTGTSLVTDGWDTSGYIQSDAGEGQPEHAAELLSAFLRKFRPTERFRLSYAVMASKNVPDGFSGGYADITADGVVWDDIPGENQAELIADLATCVRDLYMGWPVKELATHPKVLLDRVITLFETRGELDDEMRAGWLVDDDKNLDNKEDE